MLLLSVLIYAGYFAYSSSSMFQKIYTETGIPEKDANQGETAAKLTVGKPFSILLLGTDARTHDVGRTDTMIYMTVNPTKKEVILTSIPRDTRVFIPKKNKEDKINHAYAFGGVPLSIQTTEQFLDAPVDFFIKINMEGFRDLVDAVGGVTVNNDKNISIGEKSFSKGEVHLDGKDALTYVRIRKTDVEGDFGRQKRQQQVILAIADKIASAETIVNFDKIFEATGVNMETNLTFRNLRDILANYQDAGENIVHMAIPGVGAKIDGIYYYQVSNKAELQAEIKSALSYK
ncbi:MULTISPECIES: LCP family protein [Listeria]|uniref:LCP family glycopolymer transferase n=1 Tax=Listeria TaxID=1637 RepID=UPI0013566047|nr:MULTISPECIES: LCP family protein [Listeria]